jgi:activator of HSP90 ATPase
MKNHFSLTAHFAVKPEVVYRAWLSSKEHSEMTGSAAKVQARVGGRFSAWDGYITGKTLELQPHSRIVQAWRTGEFAESDPDSRVEILLKNVEGGTSLTLTHTDIPEGQAESYRAGWEEWYFGPMREYFGS